jgi:hypothetical protein
MEALCRRTGRTPTGTALSMCSLLVSLPVGSRHPTWAPTLARPNWSVLPTLDDGRPPAGHARKAFDQTPQRDQHGSWLPSASVFLMNCVSNSVYTPSSVFFTNATITSHPDPSRLQHTSQQTHVQNNSSPAGKGRNTTGPPHSYSYHYLQS